MARIKTGSFSQGTTNTKTSYQTAAAAAVAAVGNEPANKKQTFLYVGQNGGSVPLGSSPQLSQNIIDSNPARVNEITERNTETLDGDQGLIETITYYMSEDAYDGGCCTFDRCEILDDIDAGCPIGSTTVSTSTCDGYGDIYTIYKCKTYE